MKFIILGFAVIISVSWHMLQSGKTNSRQDAKIQVNGKVHRFKGKIVVNIQDNHLTLRALDRFTLMVRDAERLTIQIIEKPNKQRCEVVESKQNETTIRLNIYCQTTENLVLNNPALRL